MTTTKITVTPRINGGVMITAGTRFLLFDRAETEKLLTTLSQIITPRIQRYSVSRHPMDTSEI